MKKLLIIADVSYWAFANLYSGIRDNINKEWFVDVCYMNEGGDLSRHQYFDVVFYLCDNYPDPIIQYNIPFKKLILGLRQSEEINHPIYYNLNKYFVALAASNKELYERYSKRHNNVFYAPGGIDTNHYSYVKRNTISMSKIVLGWAGSRDNFGRNYRGLDIIESAISQRQDLIFSPALKEVNRKNKDEMKEYYSSIDIYVEMSSKAGRQNGMLEAGATGIPIISTDCGISSEIIHNGENGYLIERNENSLLKAIDNTLENYFVLSNNIEKDVRNLFSWEKQIYYFKNMFEFVYSESMKGDKNGII